MAVIFEPSLVRVISASGKPIPAAKMYFYEAGTSVLQDFYLDADGTPASANPLVADAAGRFAPAFISTDVAYRIRLTDSSGSIVLWDVDPVTGAAGGGGSGSASTVASAKLTAYPGAVMTIQTGGFNTPGKGAALYRRKTVAPTTAPTYNDLAWFQSADGAYWEIAETTITPFMFGAVADGVWDASYGGVTNLSTATDDTLAITAMFDLIRQTGNLRICDFAGGIYFCRYGVTLPLVVSPTPLVIQGGGGWLATNEPDVTLMKRVPISQFQAGTFIDRSKVHISNLGFYGDGISGTVGLHIAACYTPVVESCQAYACDYGMIGTFVLAGAWRDLQIVNCTTQGLKLRSGAGDPGGSVIWTGATESNSASNVNLVDNVRVFNTSSSVAAFAVYASSDVQLRGCISEGTSGAGSMDVDFNYGASSTVKNFKVDGFHCENQGAVINFRIRGTGNVTIRNVKLTYPAVLCDAHDSISLRLYFEKIPYLDSNPPVSAQNPNQRLFYHTNGGGYGGTESGDSAGSGWDFRDCGETLRARFMAAANWENAALPVQGYYGGFSSISGDVVRDEYSTGSIMERARPGSGLVLDGAVPKSCTVADLTTTYSNALRGTRLTVTDTSVTTPGSAPASGGANWRGVQKIGIAGVLADWIIG